MVNKTWEIIIDNEAKEALHKAYNYIKKDSLQNAEKVRLEILTSIKNLAQNPELHNPDKYRINNENNAYRAYEIYNYRISYHISNDEIRIIRIRHTKMNPLEY